MQFKTILIAAMLCLAMAGISAAQDLEDEDCCWEKPCGTPVEQCDDETTFVLYDVDNSAVIAETADGYVYLDMKEDLDNNGDRVITPNDVRLTWWHTNYAPNTKVADDDYDNGAVITDVYNDYMFTYMDINYNNKYDIYDPVYIDFEDQFGSQGTVSIGDIRLTDVPPVTPVKMVDAPNPLQEGTIVDTSEFVGLERWEPVLPKDADIDADLELIGSMGSVSELVAWVDADDSGEWNCADKLYINQPNNGMHDKFVTIGDVRLFIPEGDECVPECGTKVLQGEHDATYILNFVKDLQLAKSVECNAVYVDMDNNNKVSYGDVRLSEVNKQINGQTIHYEPNTKVKVCEEADLNDNLFALPDTSLTYLDIDGNLGYSLNDPVYFDFPDQFGVLGTVSDGDIRLTDSPVTETGALAGAYYGGAWSVVDAILGAEDEDVGMTLTILPGLMQMYGLEHVIGYIDSDCTGTWTCSDKLYVQQLVGCEVKPAASVNGIWDAAFDEFVTVGDLRLYIPQEAIDNEDWLACGTKVKMCDVDAEYALGIDVMNLISFADRNYNDVFDNDDAAYVDMDNSRTVTDGDVRLTSVTRKNTTYEPNTKVVCDSTIEDGDVGLQLEGHGTYWYYGIYTDLLSMLADATSVKVFDTDCSGTWTCVDALYVQYNDGYDPITKQMSPVDNFVTHMDGRLYIPPDMICDGSGQITPTTPFWVEYDTQNPYGVIVMDEVMNAINDFFDEQITIDQVMEVINKFFEPIE
ncbi:hypothetical protein HNV12_04570 [Methanococcoides sp. SA1]|nr:hypothetical protein [Methanococcoides sp. SA1]